jgi:uncharacterized protein
MERRVLYFPDHGEQNTPAVVECVARRLDERDVSTVVVATSTGKTALAFAEGLGTRAGLRLVAVANAPGSQYGTLTPEYRPKLAAKGVVMVDYAPYATASLLARAQRNAYGALDLFAVAADLWRMMGGQGLKVAMEVGLMATNVGVLQPAEKVITVGGTGSGADTAIVMKTAYSPDLFADDPSLRPEMIELLCTPLTKKWW